MRVKVIIFIRLLNKLFLLAAANFHGSQMTNIEKPGVWIPLTGQYWGQFPELAFLEVQTSS